MQQGMPPKGLCLKAEMEGKKEHSPEEEREKPGKEEYWTCRYRKAGKSSRINIWPVCGEDGNVRGEKKMNTNMRPMLLSNNQRKMHGLPLHRKKNKGKRYLTRCEGIETIRAFVDYCDQR